MSPRPRTVSDDQIFAATARAVTRLGPTRLTLADVADEVGLSAAALVQRFGSKRGLLLAFVSTPDELANSVAFLQMDLSDPDFRKPALANSKQILAGYAALIRDAIDAGE